MKSITNKFETLIRRLNYSCISFSTLDVSKIENWCRKEMPLVVEELVDNGWDLSKDDTWLTNTFTDYTLDWYDKRVAVFLTSSWQEYKLFSKVINYKKFQEFRKHFNIDMQVCLLVHPVIFLEIEDLDTIYLNFDFDKGYCHIDVSHFDDDDNLEENFDSSWSWLMYDNSSNDEWSVDQVAKAYSESIYY